MSPAIAAICKSFGQLLYYFTEPLPEPSGQEGDLFFPQKWRFARLGRASKAACTRKQMRKKAVCMTFDQVILVCSPT